ncbi:MAG TPA: chorismate synthase [Candidatus Butyricicoccus stercorigallinarum]|nr:chorismate synthase [Candidatus Butyricicoccus stercorigallinarum]
MGSVWGNNFKLTIFGESHGGGIGCVLDGFPAGIAYDEAFVLSEMDRRAPGKNRQSTARREADLPKILSGIFEGRSTGTPISCVIENTDTRSGDYRNLIDHPRPGHADYTGRIRFHGCNDPRGGGHFSGRLTAPLVFAGAMCKLFLRTRGIQVGSHIASIGQIMDTPFDDVCVPAEQLEALRRQPYPILNLRAQQAMLDQIDLARGALDSLGGVIECAVTGVPAGLGSPMLCPAESRISSLLFAVPAVKGVEFGAGFSISAMRGSEANDRMLLKDGVVQTETNNNGGILGGITSGMPIIVRAAIKPTASIAHEQKTLNLATGQVEPLVVKGRHDPCIVTRAAPVIEAAVAVAMTDLYLEAYGYAQD